MRSLIRKAVFLLLGLTICVMTALPQRRDSAVPESATWLRFGQAIALSDFDADGLIDQARIDGSGVNRKVEVMLSRGGKPLVLQLDSNLADRGSLFAQDVDNDGATDLIWTDLLHADGVVVWLGNGGGQFARVPACMYRDGFTLAAANVDVPVEATDKTSINCPTNRSLDQVLISGCGDRVANELLRQRPDQVADSRAALGEPTDRGPPLPFC